MTIFSPRPTMCMPANFNPQKSRENYGLKSAETIKKEMMMNDINDLNKLLDLYFVCDNLVCFTLPEKFNYLEDYLIAAGYFLNKTILPHIKITIFLNKESEDL